MATQGDAPCGDVMKARPQEDGNVVIFLKEDDGASPLDRPKSTVGRLGRRRRPVLTRIGASHNTGLISPLKVTKISSYALCMYIILPAYY